MHGAAGAVEGSSIWRLGATWNVEVEGVEMADGHETPVLLGMNMLPTGHFESHYLNDAPDRTWLQADGLQVITDATAPSGDKVMQVPIPAGQGKGTFGTRTFDLTFTPGTPSRATVRG